MIVKAMAAVNKANSTVCFKAELESSGLGKLLPVFQEQGWECFQDFAFCTTDPTGKDSALFEKTCKDVLEHKNIKKEDNSHLRMLHKLRRLYQLSYIITCDSMMIKDDDAEESAATRLTPLDRASRTQALRDRISGFELAGPSQPSQKLTDRFSAMLTKGLVTYVQWEHCTSRGAEVLQEPSVKSLQISADGLALQPMEKDATVEVQDQFSWDYALRRRALACDISGLMTFESMNLWHESLKAAMLQPPPPGYRKVSWQQLRAADQALFQAVALECESGTRAPNGSEMTAFETSWRTQMFSAEVRAFLVPLPSQPASSSSSAGAASKDEIQKLKNRLANTEQALKRRRSEVEAAAPKGGGKGNEKGKKGRAARRGAATGKAAAPPEFDGLPSEYMGKRICYSYNVSACPLAKAGEHCFKGQHICPKCFGKHPLMECPRS